MTLRQTADHEEERPQRSSIAFGLPHSNTAAHPGDPTFNQTLLQHYDHSEAAALDNAIILKERARKASLDEFWGIVAEGLATILSAQIAFVSQRLYFDETTSTSLPAIGEPDSCLSALAWYYSDGQGKKEVGSNVRYHAWACPCAAMKFGKVFLIPSRVNDFAPENPNSMFMALNIDAYLGLPLFFNDECHAHFGLAWSEVGSRDRKLSWAFIESICHSFEDLISQRVVDGAAVKLAAGDMDGAQLPVEYDTGPALRSFKPPVHMLSHELRTPMQGVVGMLDIMHEIVQEAVDLQQNSKARDIFKGLKDDIETIQDSSKRAVDAADNVVQAYELENQMSSRASTAPSGSPSTTPESTEPVSPAVNPSAALVGSKRKPSVPTGPVSPRPSKLRLTETSQSLASLRPPHSPAPLPSPLGRRRESDAYLYNGNIRTQLSRVVADLLKVYGRPTQVTWNDVVNGQQCNAIYCGPDHADVAKVVKYSVDRAVPATLQISGHDLVKLVTCVLQNAIKFTHDAMIHLDVDLSPKEQSITITVQDDGPGIDPTFQPRIFEAFSRQDTSITRQTEGLGLGLAVSKGLAEKLGGSLVLIRSETTGPRHGSTFEITLPLAAKSAESSVKVVVDPIPQTKGGPTSHPQRLNTPKTNRIATTHPLNFLIAEDNDINRTLLVTMLVKLGYSSTTQIYQARDGVEAVKRATDLFQAARLKGSAAKSPIDIVLMDLWMPNMEGYEAAERILSLFKPENTAMRAPEIMAVTADVTAVSRERAKKVGMRRTLTKPFHLKDLEACVKEVWVERQQIIKE